MPSPTMKVLIVDASKENILALTPLIAGRHYAISWAGSAKEALRLLHRDDFALVLLDVRTPGSDGFKTAAQIRNSKKSADIPIIFLTSGDCEEGGIRQGYRLGAADFIQKPFDTEVLKAKLDIFAHLHGKQLETRKKSSQSPETGSILSDMDRRFQERTRVLTERLGEMEENCKRADLLNAELTCERDNALLVNETMRRFLADMSYEIRTPMTGLLGMIDFTLDSDLKPDQANQLKIARKAGKVLVKVINDVLDFTGTEAIGIPVAPWAAATPAQSGAVRQRALTVLIAEDDPITMEVMTLLTTRAGHRVIAAVDGYEALRIWESERPTLVLMDVKMPKLDGLEATRRIRNREKEIGGEVPIYGLTAHVLDEDISRCLDAGMTGHIGKPIEFPDVMKILRGIQRG